MKIKYYKDGDEKNCYNCKYCNRDKHKGICGNCKGWDFLWVAHTKPNK